jgi:hypothetical protein
MTIELREAVCADAAGIARVHVASWQTTYRGIVPDAYLDGLTPQNRQRMWDHDLCAQPGRVATVVAE